MDKKDMASNILFGFIVILFMCALFFFSVSVMEYIGNEKDKQDCEEWLNSEANCEWSNISECRYEGMPDSDYCRNRVALEEKIAQDYIDKKKELDK